MRTPGFGDKRLSSTSGVCPIAWTMSPYLPPHGRLSRRGSIIASKSVVPDQARPLRPAGHRGEDHERVLGPQCRLEPAQHAHVLVVHVDVDVAVELPTLG